MNETLSQNRLDLDFSIESTEDRLNFINQYILRPEFQRKHLTSSELETISKYILSGKEPSGRSSAQEFSIELETKYKTWDPKKVESLDALVESPTYREPTYTQTPVLYRTPREVFSREETRRTAPTSLLPYYEQLWRQIDELELQINYYDLSHEKRTKPPREELLNRFSLEERQSFQELASTLSSYAYLQKRHLIVELRREQYTLRDGFTDTLHQTEPDLPIHVDPPALDVDIPVLPLGLAYADDRSAALFGEDYPLPSSFTEGELQDLLINYWRKNSSPSYPYFDFRELEHIYNAFYVMDDLDGSDIDTFSTNPAFLSTLNWYIRQANLTDTQREILSLKLSKHKNQEIAAIVNKRYSKSYTANYISTIFRQKIIPAINDAARLHAEIVENLPYPENFKKCRCCGRTLLLSTDNFVRKARSSDGFNSQCKRCDSEERTRRKNTSINYKKVNNDELE